MCRSLYCSGASLTARVQGSQPLDTQAGAPKGTLTWPQSAPVFSQSGQRRLTGCAWSLIVDTPSFISNTIVTPLIPSLSTLSLAGNQARNTYILPLPKGLLSVCVGGSGQVWVHQLPDYPPGDPVTPFPDLHPHSV